MRYYTLHFFSNGLVKKYFNCSYRIAKDTLLDNEIIIDFFGQGYFPF